MKYLFLSKIESLIPLLDITIGESCFDLHNDFRCTRIMQKKNILEFYFARNINSDVERSAVIIFSDIVESNYSKIKNDKQVGDTSILTNFSKGLLTNESPYFIDKRINYFFIDFFDGEMINILCKDAIIIFW